MRLPDLKVYSSDPRTLVFIKIETFLKGKGKMANEITELINRMRILDAELAKDLEEALDRRALLHGEFDPKIAGDGVRELLQQLATAPDSQLDGGIARKLGELASRDIVFPSHIKVLLDECAFASLASGFIMRAMNMAMEMIEKNGIPPKN